MEDRKGRPIHLVATCRDPSGANAIISVIDRLLRIPDFQITIVSQSPATAILHKKFGRVFKRNKIHHIDLSGHDQTSIQECLFSLYNIRKPKILLTTTSGPDFGVDEIATHVYTKINSIVKYTIQCYWGDLNTSLNSFPDFLFVCDELAFTNTAAKYPQLNIVQTGYLNEDLFRTFPTLSKRLSMRQIFAHPNDKKAIIFFSQPLTNYDWYWQTIDDLAIALSSINTPNRVYIKSHPKDDPRDLDRVLKCFQNQYIDTTDISSSDPLDALSLSDLALSLFSTIGSDLQKMLAYSDLTFSVPLYLFHNHAAQSWFRSTTGLRQIPLSNDKLAFVSYNKDDLSSVLDAALSKDQRSICHANLKTVLNNEHRLQSPSDTIISCMLDNIA